ncbi:Protein bicaudal D homolog [Caenorhabditis elegans]|uniref:Isoform b of Protein bicaudal D homolog n=1 Tax=Caenorhabditis elegans TaxID=6239 RepID=V6CJ04-2|nr:Protein bicaudal D homolog [Caenorhabditis elegans]CDK13419.1 Protein bicaudal D homolog [Caenorhabditis elegans]|eukprot:NP_001293735.1 Protein bicaudal D homolog [Caenorhabditis elegans]
MAESELEKLRQDIAILTEKYEQAKEDIHKAANAGLELLRQKEDLEKRLAEMQAELDLARTEIDKTNQTLAEYRSQHQRSTRSELENEESLLEESSAKEEEYLQRIAKLEADLKKKEQELAEKKEELESIEKKHSKEIDSGAALEDERRKLRAELKETKEREQRLISEYSELEEENIGLQKTVANLRGSQVEYESLRIDNNRLEETIEIMKMAAEEDEILRVIADKQLEEALLTAQQERDQRLAMKRELEQTRNAEHISSLNDMLFGLERLGEDGELPPPQPGASDLFSELQGSSDVKVRELEAAKEGLQEELKSREKIFIEFVTGLADTLNIHRPTNELDYMHARQQKDVVLEKIQNIARDTDRHDKEGEEKRSGILKADLRTLVLVAGEKSAQLAAAQDAMIQVSDQLYQFYHQMTQNQGVQTEKSVQEIVKKLRLLARANAEDVPRVSLADEGVESGTETDVNASRSIPLNSDRLVIAPSFAKEIEKKLASVKIGDVLSETDLRQRILTEGNAISETTESLKKMIQVVKRTSEQAFNQAVMASGAENEIEMQNMKLRSLLSTKRDQISTLRTVLKSNKLTAESALTSMREKYESEKKMMMEINDKMRRELKQLKEDAATFASHRAMFTARGEELKSKVEELSNELRANEEEKKTLNQLLRLAIQQKLTLTQRLEEVEVDRDRQTYQPPRAVRYPGSTTTAQQPAPSSSGGSRGGPRRGDNQQ